jgi:hypothetical protein
MTTMMLKVAGKVLARTLHSALMLSSVAAELETDGKALLKWYPGATLADLRAAGELLGEVLLVLDNVENMPEYAALWREANRVLEEDAEALS